VNRQRFFNFIEEKLNILAYRIEQRGKLNHLELHNHSENFYLRFLNELFGWKLENVNVFKSNVAAIDLIDRTNRIMIQVSATATTDKIESALAKDIHAYSGYSFKFVSISKDAASLRRQTYQNPSKVTFDPKNDIYDITSILGSVRGLEIEALEKIDQLVRQELGSIDETKIETNLAKVIKLLSENELDPDSGGLQTISFEIDRKIEFNSLVKARYVIEEHAKHCHKLDKVYAEFDKQGVNKSTSVLASIRKTYVQNMEDSDNDSLFFKILDLVTEKVRQSKNYVPIPYEELEVCVNVIVVNAFLRCKIFKNPKGYSYVAP